MKPPAVLGSTILAISLLAMGPAVAQQPPPNQPDPQGQTDQQPPPDQPDQQAAPDQAPQADQQPPEDTEDQGRMEPAQPEEQPAQPNQPPRGKKTSCTMKFDLQGWS